MAFDKDGLKLIAPGPSPEGQSGNTADTYRYATTDTAGSVVADGYFDGALENGLTPGDVIIASCNMGGTPSFRHLGVTVGGADVTVINLDT